MPPRHFFLEQKKTLPHGLLVLIDEAPQALLLLKEEDPPGVLLLKEKAPYFF